MRVWGLGFRVFGLWVEGLGFGGSAKKSDGLVGRFFCQAEGFIQSIFFQTRFIGFLGLRFRV